MTNIFKEEIKKLNNIDFQAFVENAIQAAPKTFTSNEETILHARKVFKLTEEMLDNDHVQGTIRDVILTGVLISDVGLNYNTHLNKSHPYIVRELLDDLKDVLNPQLWTGVMKIVESHEGTETEIDDLVPKPGSPEHIVALANRIVRSQCVEIILDTERG